jgi:hypothetical protein
MLSVKGYFARMRFATLSLALYLLALALVPCQDLVFDTPYVAYGWQNAHPGDGEDDHNDHCTPLCSCACCSVTTDVPPLLTWSVSDEALPPRGATTPRFVPAWSPVAYVAGSWQPPRA